MQTKSISIALLAILVSCTAVKAQYKWKDPQQQEFRVIRGQGWPEELKGSYARLPRRAEAKVRKPVWDLSRQSAGLSIAFRSHASEIKVRYVVSNGFSMPHMPATGVSGVDLYATDMNGESRWCAGKYAFRDTVSYTFKGLSYVSNPEIGYEYQLFLPLYNTIKWMEIGVPVNAKLDFSPASIEKPIVIYGTSIAQGACASRPGMAWGNIVNRKLEHPVVNLGFSGNGKLEDEIFDLLLEIDAKLYIIDCMPNLSGREAATLIYNRTRDGIKKLRSKSSAPILLVEHSGYTNEYSSKEVEESYRIANEELHKAYKMLIQEGVTGLYYLTKEEIGLSMDAMVEGVHPSDLGMEQYANSYIKKIKEILHEESEGPVSCTPRKQQRDSYDWNERHEQILKMNRESAAEILMIGNSITHYWAGEPVARAQHGKKAWDELFHGKKVRNLGFGWDKTENVLWRIYHGELDGFQAKKIFLLIGTNNLLFNTDTEVIEGISSVVKAIQERQPQAKLCVLGILPRKGMEDRIKKINARLQVLIDSMKVAYIDLTPQLTDEKGMIRYSLFRDGLHPNEAGYQEIAKVLKENL